MLPRCYRLTHFLFFFFNDTATTEIYTLSLHDALPISRGHHRPHQRLPRRPPHHHRRPHRVPPPRQKKFHQSARSRSEEHTSELQSPCNLVCRLLLEKKKPIETTVSVSANRSDTASVVI